MLNDPTENPREQHDQSCPICLGDNAPLAQSGSCGHSFCADCLRQFFALPPLDKNNEEEEEATHESSYMLRVQDLQDCNIDGVATLKGCPLCRSPMSLLEFKHAASLEPVWGSNRQFQLESTPLAGKTYATRRGIGYNSFHFPPFSSSEEGEDTENRENLPYFLWEEDDAMHTSVEGEGEEENPQGTKYYFQPGCFYFAPKRSFHGQLLLPDANGTLQTHDVLLDFAANHRWITGGLMFARRRQERPPSTHPLEGRWKVTWYKECLDPDANLEEQPENSIIDTAQINVVDNCALDAQSMVYHLQYHPDRIFFHWPGFGVTQTLETDFRSSTPPAVGEYLRWTTTDTQQPYIVWQRETIVDPTASIRPSITYFGRSGDRNNHSDFFLQRNTSQTWYREWRGNNNSDSNDATQQHPGRPPYYNERLWGNTFCQGLRVGLASYHFGMQPNHASEGDGTPFAYISYENDMCSQWPPLDDGSPIPPQVHFHDISLERVEANNDNPAAENNENTTGHFVFKGNILWLEDYGTTWQNNERWEYEMHFDSEFTCIVSGTVHCVTSNINESSQRQEMSHFGTDLVYVNAGILNAFDAWMRNADDNHDADEPPPGDLETPADVYPRYTHISRALRRRLQAEGASVRTVAMLNMIFTHSLQPGSESPVDYNT